MSDDRSTPWEPLTVARAREVLAGLDVPWWLAGGHAIEAFVGHRLRDHGDLDVGILRPDHVRVRAGLAAWDLHVAERPGSLRPWRPGEVLPPTAHDVWARERGGSPWRWQLLLDERDEDAWTYRRDRRVRLPLDRLTWRHAGVAWLAPEVQLLYKARAPRPKDEVDFAAALPLLDDRRRAWLDGALALAEPASPWRARLAAAGGPRSTGAASA